MSEKITFEEFSRIDIRVGTVLEVTDFPEAHKSAWKLKIDFGALGLMKSSAQITDLYSREDLEGRQVLAVVNFPNKQIGPFLSECLVLGVIGDEHGVVLIGPERSVKNGSRIA